MADKRQTGPNRPNDAKSIAPTAPDGDAVSITMDASEETAPRANGRFRKGTSGNPKGRPRGSRNAMSLLAESLLDGEADAIMRTVIERAKKGDSVALRLCVERLLPVKRERVVTIDLPPLTCPADAKGAMASIIAAVARGDLSAGEASRFSVMVNAYLQACGATDDRPDEEVRRVLRPLTYDEKIALRDVLEARLLEAEGMLDDDHKQEFLSKYGSAALLEKTSNRPKTSDTSTRAKEQSPSTRAGVRRRKNSKPASPDRLTAPTNAVPRTVSTTPKDFVPAERSKATHNAKRAKVAMATDDARAANVLSVPENTMSTKVPAVPNVPIPAHEASRKAPYRLFFGSFPYPHPDAEDPDFGEPNWKPKPKNPFE